MAIIAGNIIIGSETVASTPSQPVSGEAKVITNLSELRNKPAQKGLRTVSDEVPISQMDTDAKKSQYMLDVYNSTELLSFDEE